MRKLMTFAALALAACGSHASGGESGERVAPSGSGTTRSFSVADFSRVAAQGSDDVIVTVGPAFAVRAEGPAKELDRLDIRRDGDTLKIGRERTVGISWGSREPVRIYVAMPAIAAANVAGSGDMRVDRAAGSAFSGSVAGSGNLTIDALTSREAKLSIAGSGDITASGAVDSVKMSIAGSGNLRAGGLKASSAKVSIAGSGNVRADVNGPADVSVVGSGVVDVGRNAKCTSNARGSGSVRCG